MYLANAVLVIHTLFIVFVVLTVPLVYLGKFLSWQWVRLFWLRILHLVGICVVAAQSWLGFICPLTTLEMWLRAQGGYDTYAGSFIAYWLQQLIYWDLPAWVFTLVYSLFALLVVMTWYWVPPIRRREGKFGSE